MHHDTELIPCCGKENGGSETWGHLDFGDTPLLFASMSTMAGSFQAGMVSGLRMRIPTIKTDEAST
jgi:hypothetical protein